MVQPNMISHWYASVPLVILYVICVGVQVTEVQTITFLCVFEINKKCSFYYLF